jgi:hypothetical protein
LLSLCEMLLFQLYFSVWDLNNILYYIGVGFVNSAFECAGFHFAAPLGIHYVVFSDSCLDLYLFATVSVKLEQRTFP